MVLGGLMDASKVERENGGILGVAMPVVPAFRRLRWKVA
jgi:hypothetical protein